MSVRVVFLFKCNYPSLIFFGLTYSPYWPDHLCKRIVDVAFFAFFFLHEFSQLENFVLL